MRRFNPILARIIRNRDVIGDENINLYLNGTISDLHDGMLMKDMNLAVEILIEKIQYRICSFYQQTIAPLLVLL